MFEQNTFTDETKNKIFRLVGKSCYNLTIYVINGEQKRRDDLFICLTLRKKKKADARDTLRREQT